MEHLAPYVTHALPWTAGQRFRDLGIIAEAHG
jgi:hypothetical protein